MTRSNPKSLKAKVWCRVFPEGYDRVKKNILDPQGPTIRRWNKIFLVACVISVFVDPLFFFLPEVRDDLCIDIGMTPQVVLTVIRSVADIFYVIQIFVRFHTAYYAPSSRVFGRGKLVIDSSKIAKRYLRGGFWTDVFVALPLPQVLVWVVIPNLGSWEMTNTNNVLRLIILFQYLPRLLDIFPFSSEIVTATVFETETAWAGAAYNLLFFQLMAHVFGAIWFLLSIERQEACWIDACRQDESCQYSYFDCRSVEDSNRTAWFQSTNVTNQCNPNTSQYPFGIYGQALTYNVTTAWFLNKYFYSLWWGLMNQSTLGQGLTSSTALGEVIFSIFICTVGLVLFALIIGTMQRYLLYTTIRLENWRTGTADTKQWMHHRHLPQELRQSVRKYDQYKWIATRGVDEEALLKGLPLELRRDIKRQLCYDLVRRVPLFEEMDETTLDAICARLKPSLCTQGSYLVREGDPVNEMLFIIRGNIDSYTTNGGRTGFFNSCRIGPGDFCGEELLTWALDPHPSEILPSSTRTVKAISDVEAFALSAEDLKFVGAQFRRLLHTKQLRHKFRFYSPQWRTWAACFIQVAWLRYRRRKGAAELLASDSLMNETETPGRLPDVDIPPPGSGIADYAARMLASRRNHRLYYSRSDSPAILSPLQKPEEPDFLCG